MLSAEGACEPLRRSMLSRIMQTEVPHWGGAETGWFISAAGGFVEGRQRFDRRNRWKLTCSPNCRTTFAIVAGRLSQIAYYASASSILL